MASAAGASGKVVLSSYDDGTVRLQNLRSHADLAKFIDTNVRFIASRLRTTICPVHCVLKSFEGYVLRSFPGLSLLSPDVLLELPCLLLHFTPMLCFSICPTVSLHDNIANGVGNISCHCRRTTDVKVSIRFH
jgi:hypothetical protein